MDQLGVVPRLDGQGNPLRLDAVKGLDTGGKVKEPQQRHFDDMTVEDILKAAGEPAGITDIRIDPDLASLVRDYEHMDDESYVAFGERLAEEVGGTFKIRNDAAIMAKKDSGRSRPGLPVQTKLTEERQAFGVFSVLPGITGLAQINGVDMSDPERLARMDAQYIAQRGLLMDLKIIVATFLGRGQGDKVRA